MGEIFDTLDRLGNEEVHLLSECTGGIFGDFLGARYPRRFHSITIYARWLLALPPAAQIILSFGYSSCLESIRELGERDWGKKVVELSATDNGAT